MLNRYAERLDSLGIEFLTPVALMGKRQSEHFFLDPNPGTVSSSLSFFGCNNRKTSGHHDYCLNIKKGHVYIITFFAF